MFFMTCPTRGHGTTAKAEIMGWLWHVSKHI